MISKEKLVFDVTDANTIAASDSIGAFVRAGTDGELIDSTSNALWVHLKASDVTLDVALSHVNDSVRLGDGTNFLTSTTVGADIGLDVNLINASIAVTASDLDIRDLLYTQDSVTAYQGTSPWVVSASDLDIRDIVHTQDSIRLGDGTSFLTSTTVGADIGLDVNLINASIAVTASDLDIRDLAYTQDSVTAYQGTDPWIVNDAALANTSVAAAAVSVSTSALALPSSALAGRKYLFVQNLGNREIYVGPTGVTTASGLRLSPGAVGEFRLGASAALYGIAAGGTQDIRALELA